jgi:hypothetical protein
MLTTEQKTAFAAALAELHALDIVAADPVYGCEVIETRDALTDFGAAGETGTAANGVTVHRYERAKRRGGADYLYVADFGDARACYK